jgi:predicted CopG family antitoxin
MNRTLQLDEDAYDRLEQARGESESHSEVIRRYVPRRRSVEEILEVFRKARLSEKTLDAMDESLSRRRSMPRRRRT